MVCRKAPTSLNGDLLKRSLEINLTLLSEVAQLAIQAEMRFASPLILGLF
jgi:hypothetical protein